MPFKPTDVRQGDPHTYKCMWLVPVVLGDQSGCWAMDVCSALAWTYMVVHRGEPYQATALAKQAWQWRIGDRHKLVDDKSYSDVEVNETET